MIMGSQEFERRSSRKRRRLSERRRVFSRIGLGSSGNNNDYQQTMNSMETSTDYSWSTSSQQQQRQRHGSRSDSPSPFGDNTKISMKIQFHITIAPENEPLILDTSHLVSHLSTNNNNNNNNDNNNQERQPMARQKSTDQHSTQSIGEHIHEKLSRQNTLSTRRRQQLMALHNQTAANATTNTDLNSNYDQQRVTTPPTTPPVEGATFRSMPEKLFGLANEPTTTTNTTTSSMKKTTQPTASLPNTGREAGVRSSTITDGMSDEETMRFLAKHQQQQNAQQIVSRPISNSISIGPITPPSSSSNKIIPPREHIYFKRDGQRFGHEFTLKLSVDRTYRCLLKVRPLIPLQGISIQGHQALFVDCSQTSSSISLNTTNSFSSNSINQPASAPTSSTGLNRSWQNIHHHHNQQQQHNQANINSSSSSNNHRQQYKHNSIGRPLYHQQLSDSFLLYQQQQNQMMRHFAASHCSSTNSHLGTQLIYMFDWSASRFEVNKNKARTQIQTLLKFKNGQILTLPLQVKFYQPECKQHLSWGSQLHFIDYDCSINNMGQINIDKIQYY